MSAQGEATPRLAPHPVDRRVPRLFVVLAIVAALARGAVVVEATAIRPTAQRKPTQEASATNPDSGMFKPARAPQPNDRQGAALLARAAEALVPAAPRGAHVAARLALLLVGALIIVLLAALLGRWPDAGVRATAPWLVAVAVLHPGFSVATGGAPAAAFAGLGIVGALWLYQRHAGAKLATGPYVVLLLSVGLATLPLFEALALAVSLTGLSAARQSGTAQLATTPADPAGAAAERARPGRATIRVVVGLGLLGLFREPLADILGKTVRALSGPGLPRLSVPPAAEPAWLASVLVGMFGLDPSAVQLTASYRLLATTAVAAGLVAIVLGARRFAPELSAAWRERTRGAASGSDGSAFMRAGAVFLAAWVLGVVPASPALAALLRVGSEGTTLSGFDRVVGPWLATLGATGLLLVSIQARLWDRPLARLGSWSAKRSDLELAAMGVAAYLGLTLAPVGYGGWSWPAVLVFAVLVSGAIRSWVSPTAGHAFDVCLVGVLTAAAALDLWVLASPTAAGILAFGASSPAGDTGWLRIAMAGVAAAASVALAVAAARLTRPGTAG